MLCGAGLGKAILIGDFYGEPEAAAVDDDETWCVMVGCGLIAYQLTSPWRPYAYPPAVSDGQWWEFGRDGAETAWFDSITSVGPREFLARGEIGEARVNCDLRVVDWTSRGS